MSPMHFFKTMFVLGTVTASFVTSPVLADPDFDELVGKARAVDGDTLEFGFKRVDLWGADALERFQRCIVNGQTTACGADAWQVITNLIAAGPITCKVQGKNRYHRNMAICRNANGQDIGQGLIARGMAVARTDEMPSYGSVENSARQSRAGAWAGQFIDPLLWRRGERLPEHQTEVRRWQRDE
ncbi:thermonuclease family protein [Thalassospira xiamenensis]|jgi:endonuclease YncB( thermonuclease family)|uniref:thermonuclease family protein n=1 Tax=Thalassospira xiamenensis TaxID=220697 RepID=UPI001FFEC596|nr:thermonuclease family protein [Thalassospira xiamenensis]MCK2167535.1 thermonuclease family protein [Thalassospira xiamenensis]